MSDYVDLTPLSPRVQHFKCWNCGHEGMANQSKDHGAIICHECYHGQDEDGTDYLELWYPNLSREKAKERQNTKRTETRKQLNDVTVRL
jgi:hypothetical protein